MFEEYEVVRARRQLSEKVPPGAKGTILLVYRHPNLAYEVEFLDSEGESLELLTVADDDITRVKNSGE
jgi:hypothetical protein